ncbi:unnamed protein product [Lactuca saligna]|uniref:Uncharacterized protein n=1 Tax=Lactuca saligna TaxID=75948 RepID=A0AA36EDQ9_LACSI|nr:unnamed protein product [Lactuca saligna]
MHLLSSAPSSPGDVLVIPDDDVKQSEGVEGGLHQPIILISLGTGVSPPSSRGSPERLFHGPSVVGALRNAPVFVPGWSLRFDCRLSVRSVAWDFLVMLFLLPPWIIWIR